MVLGRDSTSFFCMWVTSGTSNIYWKKLFFSPFNYLGTLVKNQLIINIWIYFFTFTSIPLIYMPIFMPVSQSLDYCTLIVSLKSDVGVHQLFVFCKFFSCKFVWFFCVPQISIWILEPISAKKYTCNFDRDCCWIL